ncbi:MAG: hypothetical protein IT332_09885 [Ardenticatenales bacterium]|nr:hypothetical protein [Ardenticatenales bacterium]
MTAARPRRITVRITRRITRHAPLAIVVALYLCLAAAYAWRVPILEGADEHGHASYIDFVAAHHALPPIGTVWESVQPPLYYVVAAAVNGVAGGRPLVPVTLRLNDGFRFDDPSSADVFDPRSYDPADARPARRLRLLSTLFGAATLVLIYATALAAGRGRCSIALAAAALPALTPMFAHHNAVLTNDALATTWCALLTWQLVRSVTGDGSADDRAASRRRSGDRLARDRPSVPCAVRMGIVVGVGMWTKYTMAPVAAAAGLGLILLPGTRRVRLARSLRFTLTALAVSGPWLAWNTWRYGDPLAGAAMRRAHAVLAVDLSPPALTVDPAFLWGVFISYWGKIGSMTVPLHVDAYAFFGLLTALGVLGLPLAIRRRTIDRGSAAVLGLIAGLTWCAFLVHNARLSAVQGRLLFPALPAISTLLAAGWAGALDAVVAAWATGSNRTATRAPIVRRLPLRALWTLRAPSALQYCRALPVAALIAGLMAINLQTLAGPVQFAFHDAPAARGRAAVAVAVAERPRSTGDDRAAMAASARDVASAGIRAKARPAPRPSTGSHATNPPARGPTVRPASLDPSDPAVAQAAVAAGPPVGGAPRRDGDRTANRRPKPTPPSGVGPGGAGSVDDRAVPPRRHEPNGDGPVPETTAEAFRSEGPASAISPAVPTPEPPPPAAPPT